MAINKEALTAFIKENPERAKQLYSLDAEKKNAIVTQMFSSGASQGTDFSLPEIKEKPFTEKAEDVFGTAAQVAGSIGGGIIGAGFGRPDLGGALGSGLSRIVADVADVYNAYGAGPTAVGANAKNTKELLEKAPEIAARAGGSALLDFVGGKAIGLIGQKIVKPALKGIADQVLGARVTERGIERGFNKLLKSEYFQKGIPARIKGKMGGFFNNLKNTLGREVKDSVYSEVNKNVEIPIAEINEPVNKLIRDTFPGELTFTDLDISKVEAARLEELTNKVLRTTFKKKTMKLPEVWELRKDLDKLIYSKKLRPDGVDYARKLRNIISDTLKTNGDEAVTSSFKKYSSAVGIDEKLGASYETIQGISGKEFAPKMESVASNLLKENKDEMIALLKDADVFQGADDKIIEEFLDYSAAESLDKTNPGLYWQKILAGMLGGKKKVAEIAAQTQSQGFKTVLKALSKTPKVATAAYIGSEEL